MFCRKYMHVAFPMSSSCRVCFVVSDLQLLTALKESVTTAAGDEFCDIFPNFQNIRYDIRGEISKKSLPITHSWQTIRMKYHALFVIFEKAVKFEIVVCCDLKMALYWLTKKSNVSNTHIICPDLP